MQEELVSIGSATAFGRTPVVSGTLTIDGTMATTVDIEADLTALESDSGFRDGALGNQALETDTFPTATFRLTEPIDFGAVPEEGVVLEATAVGDLNLHGVVNQIEIPIAGPAGGRCHRRDRRRARSCSPTTTSTRRPLGPSRRSRTTAPSRSSCSSAAAETSKPGSGPDVLVSLAPLRLYDHRVTVFVTELSSLGGRGRRWGNAGPPYHPRHRHADTLTPPRGCPPRWYSP